MPALQPTFNLFNDWAAVPSLPYPSTCAQILYPPMASGTLFYDVSFLFHQLFFFSFVYCLYSLCIKSITHFPLEKKSSLSVMISYIHIPICSLPSQSSILSFSHALSIFFPHSCLCISVFLPLSKDLPSNCQWPPGFKMQLIHLIPSLLSLLHAICHTTELLWNPTTLDLWDVVLYYMSSCFAARYSLCFPQHSLKTHVSQFYS